MASRVALEGERKHVTVLFADDLAEPVEAWQLVGAHGARTRLESRGGALSRFVAA